MLGFAVVRALANAVVRLMMRLGREGHPTGGLAT
jgi:hypothetical protein